MLIFYFITYDSTLLHDPPPGSGACPARSRSHYEWHDYTPCATRADVELTLSITGFVVTGFFALLRWAIAYPRRRRKQRANGVEAHALATRPPRDDDGDRDAGISVPAPAYAREAEDVMEPPPAYTSQAPSRTDSLANIAPSHTPASSGDSLSWHSAIEPEDSARPNGDEEGAIRTDSMSWTTDDS
ncbi:MAG: hypothetical protein Q9202_001530 [Teloschistes flavicans]